MTRQWLDDPSEMCMTHILGEHLEAHIFVSKMLKGHSLQGFRDGSMFFGASFVKERHDLIAELLPNHRTPLEIEPHLLVQYPYIEPTEENKAKSRIDLMIRCPRCVNKMVEALRERTRENPRVSAYIVGSTTG